MNIFSESNLSLARSLLAKAQQERMYGYALDLERSIHKYLRDTQASVHVLPKRADLELGHMVRLRVLGLVIEIFRAFERENQFTLYTKHSGIEYRFHLIAGCDGVFEIEILRSVQKMVAEVARKSIEAAK